MKQTVRRVAHPAFGAGCGAGLIGIVSEPGLYRLIMRSDKPDAIVFQNWIAEEVLPSIRKTGKYALSDHGRDAMPLPMDIAEAIASFTAAQQEGNRLLAEVLAAMKAGE
jgi:prophage antirepressor-like protein